MSGNVEVESPKVGCSSPVGSIFTFCWWWGLEKELHLRAGVVSQLSIGPPVGPFGPFHYHKLAGIVLDGCAKLFWLLSQSLAIFVCPGGIWLALPAKISTGCDLCGARCQCLGRIPGGWPGLPPG